MLKATRRLKSPNFADRFFGVVFYLSILFICVLPFIIFFLHEKMNFIVMGMLIITAIFLASTINSFSDFNSPAKSNTLYGLATEVNFANESYFIKISNWSFQKTYRNILFYVSIVEIPYIAACYLTDEKYAPLFLSAYSMVLLYLFFFVNGSVLNKEIVSNDIFNKIDNISNMSQTDKAIFKHALTEGMQINERFTRAILAGYIISMSNFIAEKWNNERKLQESLNSKIFQYQFNKEDK